MFDTVEVTESQIQNLRSLFLKELESKGGDEVIHAADLSRVKSGDEWLKRFLLHHDGNEKEALGMLWEAVNWRKEFKTNEITINNVNMDFIREGVFFSHGRDKDGSKLFIVKFKKYQKSKDFEDVKRCIIYWLERLEREEHGKPVTIFFDMEGCGVSNVDLDLTKYIINVFKFYYPYFLNFILILEMAWILNAVFKVIKTMLPEKAVERIKFLKKNGFQEYVDPEQALKSWGGKDNYSFVFEPEVEEVTTNVFSNNKKVHFADGSPMTEAAAAFNDKEQGDGVLKVYPPGVINFVNEGTELVSTLELHNTDSYIIISYKMKTTSPEKFRVRPSAGCLAPGERTTISVTLMPGFQLGGLSRDKFLVMSMSVDSVNLSAQELAELWKNPLSKNILQHRLRCAQGDDIIRNGVLSSSSLPTENGHSQITQLTNKITQLTVCQSQLHISLKRTQKLQQLTLFLVVVLSIITLWVLKNSTQSSGDQFCSRL